MDEQTMNDEIPPRPWSVRVHDDNGECLGILDANGDDVVVTDSGSYPPDRKTAELIVRLVNEAKNID